MEHEYWVEAQSFTECEKNRISRGLGQGIDIPISQPLAVKNIVGQPNSQEVIIYSPWHYMGWNQGAESDADSKKQHDGGVTEDL